MQSVEWLAVARVGDGVCGDGERQESGAEECWSHVPDSFERTEQQIMARFVNNLFLYLHCRI